MDCKLTWRGHSGRGIEFYMEGRLGLSPTGAGHYDGLRLKPRPEWFAEEARRALDMAMAGRDFWALSWDQQAEVAQAVQKHLAAALAPGQKMEPVLARPVIAENRRLEKQHVELLLASVLYAGVMAYRRRALRQAACRAPARAHHKGRSRPGAGRLRAAAAARERSGARHPRDREGADRGPAPDHLGPARDLRRLRHCRAERRREGAARRRPVARGGVAAFLPAAMAGHDGGGRVEGLENAEPAFPAASQGAAACGPGGASDAGPHGPSTGGGSGAGRWPPA